MRPLPAILLLSVLLGGSPLRAQGITQLSLGGESYTDVLVSPDGRSVAFRAPGRIGVLPYEGGAEVPIAAGPNLGSFIWARSSVGIYYVDSDFIRFAGRTGGGTSTVASMAGQRPRLWCVSDDDTTLYGTRYDTASSTERIFSVDSSGLQAPANLVVAVPQMVIDEVCLDPTGAFLVYREALNFPFPPVEFFRIDVDGSNRVSLSGGPIGLGNPANVAWVDGGSTIAFTITSQASFRPQIGRIGPSGTAVEMLTEGFQVHRKSAVTADRQWILHETQYPTATGIATGPAILPAQGGGVVPLAAGDDTIYQLRGAPSADDTGTRIAFSAIVPVPPPPECPPQCPIVFPQIFTVDTDRELRVAPRVEIGGTFNVDLPLDADEVAFVFLGFPSAPALPLPGFSYGLALDPTTMVVIGAGSAADLSIPLSVPRRRVFRGTELAIQALRTEALVTGGFTRYARFRIF